MQLKSFKNQEGTTLIEVVIYIGVIAIIFLSIISLIVQLVQLKMRADSLSAISSEASNFFEKVVLDMRNCDSFLVVDSSTLQVTKSGVTSTYHLSNSKVYINDGVDDSQLTSNLVEITNLTFVDWTSTNSDNLVHAEVSLSRGGISETFQTSIHKR